LVSLRPSPDVDEKCHSQSSDNTVADRSRAERAGPGVHSASYRGHRTPGGRGAGTGDGPRGSPSLAEHVAAQRTRNVWLKTPRVGARSRLRCIEPAACQRDSRAVRRRAACDQPWPSPAQPSPRSTALSGAVYRSQSSPLEPGSRAIRSRKPALPDRPVGWRRPPRSPRPSCRCTSSCSGAPTLSVSVVRNRDRCASMFAVMNALVAGPDDVGARRRASPRRWGPTCECSRPTSKVAWHRRLQSRLRLISGIAQIEAVSQVVFTATDQTGVTSVALRSWAPRDVPTAKWASRSPGPVSASDYASWRHRRRPPEGPPPSAVADGRRQVLCSVLE